jgi:superfamily II DNA or RNA helicase
VRLRGRAAYLDGRVRQLPPSDGAWVRAEVRGHRVYTVSIRGEGQLATPHCTCSFFAAGSYCKHIWATLLDVQEKGALAGAESKALTDEGATPAFQKARKRAGPRSSTRRSEAAWVGRLSLLRPPRPLSPVVASSDADSAPDDQTPAPTFVPLFVSQRQVCYVVSADLSLRYRTLVIEVQQRQPTRAGWGPMKPWRIAPGMLGDLPDGVDRELCALLLGATRVDGGEAAGYGSAASFASGGNWAGHGAASQAAGVAPPLGALGAFAPLPGAWRSLLKRMIQTGRCFLRPAESLNSVLPEAPVRLNWNDDEAWVLWLVGLDTGDGLSLNLELRRGDDRMPITQPALVLGGSDGLVFYEGLAAPLDDRGAGRWVAHFREEAPGYDVGGAAGDGSSGEGAGAIRVPARDIDRFLERLYRFPDLPELELPPGTGREELHVAPVPHLELFTSAGNAVIDAGQLRNLLLARVHFTYGPHRVAPGTAGRFIAGAVPLEDGVGDVARVVEDGNGALAAPGRDSTADQSPADSDALLIRRDRRRESEELAVLTDLGFRPTSSPLLDAVADALLPIKLMPLAVGELLRRGWVVRADQQRIRGAGNPSFKIRSGIDWFELRGGVAYTIENGAGEQQVTLPEILAAARAGKAMIQLGDGTQGLLPVAWLESHGLLAGVGEVEGDHLRFRTSQAALLDALLDQQELTDVDERFDQARQALRHFQAVTPLDAAASFQGALRPYQRDGLGWLDFLRLFGLGGILADDMGLGKTIQVLAMLDARYRAEPKPPPTLIVVPRSVVFNWMDEAAKFTPSLKMQAYTGADRHGLRAAFAEHNIIVTSYGLMRRDIAELRKHRFDYVVLDEAQAIKNPGAQAAKAARLLHAEHRLALTGTPVENHLGDLWSIFEFLNPGMLGSAATFAQIIRMPGNGNGHVNGNGQGDGNGDEAAVNEPAAAPSTAPAPASPGTGGTITAGAAGSAGEPRIGLTPVARGGPGRGRGGLSPESTMQLARALRPFILRRTKKQVLTELPEKTEQTILCTMEPPQREVYDQLLRHYRLSLLNQVDQRGMGRSTVMVLEALLRLRQAACHPGLIDPQRPDAPSAKLDELLERVGDLIDEGHKALVFSQFTSMLALVRRQLDQRQINYEYLDGQTRHRRQHVQRFQTDPQCRLFLISLKAGGLGLNLTAAEYVFILDPWWNPAVEAQAIDRAHRIGQTRHVFAYRLICQDTVEQRIAELQQKKKQLADAIIGGQETLLRTLTREELAWLLS